MFDKKFLVRFLLAWLTLVAIPVVIAHAFHGFTLKAVPVTDNFGVVLASGVGAFIFATKLFFEDKSRKMSEIYTTPLWLAFTSLYFLFVGIVPLGRWLFEGHAYDVSLSSEYGDTALIVCIMIGTTVLRRETITGWLAEANLHSTLAISCLLAGTIANCCFMNAVQITDIYHNIVVIPFLSYLLIVAVLITFKHGTKTEKTAMVAFVVIWTILVVVDIYTGRLDQQKWLAEHCNKF